MVDEALQRAVTQMVEIALAEDVGSGDVTASLIPFDRSARATVISREAAVVCGRPWFDATFRQIDAAVQIAWHVEEAARVQPDTRLCTITGRARSLLTGERTALNFLQTLSGTATVARRYADAVADYPVKILDTRKTLPGLRLAQKYAVRCGGCHNHRHGLYDAILIKENHIMAAGSIAAAVATARQSYPGLTVEVEVENLDEVAQGIVAGADMLLLDDFDLTMMGEAVAYVRGRAKLEVSGSVSLEQLPAIARTGVDLISVGALTKHLQAVDLSMRFVMAGA
jgi:nicotinate-nucleotide pyrophosphorylase (carboxylating)